MWKRKTIVISPLMLMTSSIHWLVTLDMLVTAARGGSSSCSKAKRGAATLQELDKQRARSLDSTNSVRLMREAQARAICDAQQSARREARRAAREQQQAPALAEAKAPALEDPFGPGPSQPNEAPSAERTSISVSKDRESSTPFAAPLSARAVRLRLRRLVSPVWASHAVTACSHPLS